ncbi:RNI-like protein [Basidiobolus meristosporus CBS 931.73]|uniref:RNI-like protein n=1 Tax=Basidiobolus meristosporus CBS 931.73 TaxID=1314790 RepID=A0A1Y1Y2A9_9FUNG|nr:RNI-like protein [Basidiobolus meristosporus CBS 931.73]|eukprot:ORX92118.1 RNI-like protein [Basidiobolus meristosporus CBS 931.73]
MSLPPEILTEIFSYLDSPGQLYSCIRVCTIWSCIASSMLWYSPKPSGHAVKSITRLLVSLQSVQSRNAEHEVMEKTALNPGVSVGPRSFFTCNYSLFVEELNFSSQKSTQLYIQDPFIQAIASNCPNIKKVDLTNCYKLTDIAIKALSANCRKIRHFSIAGCTSISDAAIATMADCFPQLQVLSVKHCFIGGSSLASVVKGCPNLTSLDVSHCQNISRPTLECIFGTGRKFESLQLEYCGATHSVVQKIATYSGRLKHLNLNNVYILTDSTIIELAHRSSALTHLGVASSSISDSGILALAQNCRKLKSVDISYCGAVTDQSILALATQCPELEHLSMGYCDKISDVGVITLANCLPYIRSIDITFCGQISDVSVKALLGKCLRLESLKMGYCVHVTKEAIHSIPEGLVTLRHLNVSGMQDLRDDDIRTIMKKHPRLKNLGLKGCMDISDEFWG